jgi:hypothetical protein
MLIYPIVKQQKERTPIPSSHPSRPSFDERKEELMYMLKETPKNYSHAKAGVSSHAFFNVYIAYHSGLVFKALLRNGHRCVLTGSIDIKSSLEIASLPDNDLAPTELAHIFSQSTTQKISEGRQKVSCSYSHWVFQIRTSLYGG